MIFLGEMVSLLGKLRMERDFVFHSELCLKNQNNISRHVQ